MVLMTLVASCKKDNGNENGNEGKPSIDVPGEAVDLGLSVKWANRNIGAATAEDLGLAFGWGCSEPSTPGTWAPTSIYPFKDDDLGPEKLSGEYDIATVIWGDGWRMPTKEEINALNNLGYTEVKKNGTAVGATFQGTNGASIYIPYGSPDYSYFYIWSSERTVELKLAYFYGNKNMLFPQSERSIAHYVRPVKDK